MKCLDLHSWALISIVYVADVGSGEADSERLYKAPLAGPKPWNAGWPYIEGIPFDNPNEAQVG